MTAYTISGQVEVTALDDSELASIAVDTSDGPGNCVLAPFPSTATGPWAATYTCTVFDWGNGWDGYITTQGTAGKVACTPQRTNYAGITSSMKGQNVGCLVGNTVTVKGSVISNSTKVLLAGALLSDGGRCTIAADGLSYTCQTNVFSNADFTGWVAFGLTEGVFCPVPDLDETTGIAQLTGVKPGDVALNLVIASQSNKCPI